MASQAEVREKERRVRAFLEENDLDAVLLSRQGNFSWITCGGDSHVATGSDFGVASALVTRDGKFMLSDNIESDRLAEEEVKGQGFERLSHPWQDAEARYRLLREVIGEGRCVSDDATPGTALLPESFDALRASLTSHEVERYRELGADCGQGIEEAARAVVPGESEAAVSGRLMAACAERGIEPVVVLVAGDARMDAWRHPIPKATRIRKRAMLVLRGRRRGLICSVTRLVQFGEPDAKLQRKHEAVTAVDAELIAATRVDQPIGEVLKAGLDRYTAEGFPEEWNRHHQGGPTGYFPRDYRALPGERRPVLLNQAFAWDPSIAGTKSEDTMLALKSGPLVISLTGNWPTLTHRVGGAAIPRPDILVK
jgi:Xaa-Pro aminopeptidase